MHPAALGSSQSDWARVNSQLTSGLGMDRKSLVTDFLKTRLNFAMCLQIVEQLFVGDGFLGYPV